MSLARTNPSPYDITILEAYGPYLKTVEYGDMFDLASGIAVNNLGHSNPKIKKVAHKVIDKYGHLNVYGEFNIKEQLEYAKLLGERFSTLSMSNGVGTDTKVWFTTSGSEANELAMKLAVLNNRDRRNFISLTGGFHGRTAGSLSITYKPEYREPFWELTIGEKYFLEHGAGIPDQWKNARAFFMELIQGEAGVVPINKEWAKHVSDWCKENGVLLVIDEVQTGFGRTGTQFVLDQYQDVYPDIVTIGKAAGGGYPLGAVITSKEIMDKISVENPFTHLSTFGGNPLACATGTVMFKKTKNKDFLENVRECGLKARLAFQDCKYASLRGKGLMLGLVLEDKKIDIDSVVQNIWKKGIFTGRVLYGSSCIRLYPPLNCSPTEIFEVFKKVRVAVEESVK